MIFDDVSTNRFRQYSEEVVKDGEISHGAEYPCITLLMNRDTKRFKEEIVKRSLMIYTRTSLPGNNPEAHERLQASVSRIQNDLTTSFYREYLRRMSERIEAEPGSGSGDMDVLNLSSSLLCRLFAENAPDGQTLPKWCAPVTLGNYQSRAYERSERILKGCSVETATPGIAIPRSDNGRSQGTTFSLESTLVPCAKCGTKFPTGSWTMLRACRTR